MDYFDGVVRAVFSSALLREMVDLSSNLCIDGRPCGDVQMEWGREGLTVRMVDSEHISVLEGKIPSACFDTYDVVISYQRRFLPSKQSVPVTALEINKLRDILTLAGPSDLIEVETLVVDQFSSVSIKTGDIRRILRCQPPNEVKTPKIFHKSSACIEAEKFSRALMAANFVGDLFDLSLDSKEMRVSVTHEKGEDVNVHFESGELRWLNASYPITTTYGLDYVVGLVRTIARRLGQDIHVHVEPRYPLKLAWFHSVNHREEPISWEYWQAPRIPKE